MLYIVDIFNIVDISGITNYAIKIHPPRPNTDFDN